MRHAFNLSRIAEKACTKGQPHATFYNRLNNVMKGGAYEELTDKELAAVDKAIVQAADEVREHISNMRKLRAQKNKK